MDLYPHQRSAVDRLRNGSILWGGVGTGKSRTAVAYYMEKECPRDVYVVTTAKKRDSLDWEGEFARVGIGKCSNATVGGVLTVDSWNNIGKFVDVRGAFFIFDEQRIVGSGKWSRAFIKIAKKNRWILLSATPGDTWMDYIPVFVANGFYKNRSDFKSQHVVYSPYTKFPKVERYIGVGKLVRHRNSVLVEMPYLRHTVRKTVHVPVEYDKVLYEEVLKNRWNPFEERPIRDVAELFLVLRKIVNSDTSRLQAVRQLLRVHPKLIVFYNFDYELEMLRGLENDSLIWDSLQERSSDSSRRTTMLELSRMGQLETTDQSTCDSSIITTTEDSHYETESGLCGMGRLSRRSGLGTGDLSISRNSSDGKYLDGTNQLLKLSNQSCRLTSSENESNGLIPRSPIESCGGEQTQISSHSLGGTSNRLLDPSRTKSGTGQEHEIVEGSSTWQTQALVGTTSLPQLSRMGPNQSSCASVARPMSQDRTESPKRTISSIVPTDATSTLQLAEWNGHKHQKIPKTDRWVYLVQYVAGAEGWNCVETDATCFFSLTYSYKNWHQAFGRIDRLNTPYRELHYYVLQSSSSIDRAVRQALDEKRNFNDTRWFSGVGLEGKMGR